MKTIRNLSLLLVSSVSANLYAAEPAPEFGKTERAFLEKHCLACHGGKTPKAEVSLEAFRDSASLLKQRKVWDNVLKMIASGEMPPKEKPRPTITEVESFAKLVKSVFDHADKNAKPDPGRVTMRRLNRVEYRNTIRDLVGVTFDPTEDFPSDDIGHGFDNIGDVLTLSPVLMERYLGAADTIMSRAIVPNPPAPVKRHLSSMFTEPANPNVGKLIDKGFRQMATDGKEFIEVGPINNPYIWDPDGDYIFRTRVFGQSGTDQPINVTILVHGKDLPDPSPDADLAKLSGNVPKPARILKTFAVKADKREAAEILEVRVPAMANRHRMVIAIDKPGEGKPASKLFIEYLALEGPLDSRPASQRKLLATEAKTQAEQTRDVMTRFLRRAFRRPIEADELARSLKLVEGALAGGEKWESAVQLAMQAALCSPKFLFRVELDDQPRGTAVSTLDEFQLASRLSYFLWSTMPDDTLLDLAEKKQLTANLDAQVRRMLADPRASALIQNFAMQWLQVKRIEFISPDGQLFPTFNVKLRGAMLKETELFIESILREDRSVLEFIDADYTFLNEPLAKHYGIADTSGNPVGKKALKPGKPIKGEEFQRVSLQDHTRGGLMTQASILTVTSNPTRTSPVKRGKWVLEQILGAPPPPPPANVPELPEDNKAVETGSLRSRLEIHRKNPSCANCHAKMDPIGFALENFDAVGAFRKKDGAFDIDSTGEFPDGSKFTGPADLKTIVMKRKDEFTRCLTEKMLIYAIGRGLEYHDRPTVDRIVKALPAGEYKFSALIAEIVKSDAFRQRRGMMK
ncbi:MAG: DUF1592 domain-containing protein [Planctomycetes bacterium]|nr:DUF1592 domain-containing protein [Planctomycetota bacterium]